jgi:hypothetical protein
MTASEIERVLGVADLVLADMNRSLRAADFARYRRDVARLGVIAEALAHCPTPDGVLPHDHDYHGHVLRDAA